MWGGSHDADRFGVRRRLCRLQKFASTYYGGEKADTEPTEKAKVEKERTDTDAIHSQGALKKEESTPATDGAAAAAAPVTETPAQENIGISTPAAYRCDSEVCICHFVIYGVQINTRVHSG